MKPETKKTSLTRMFIGHAMDLLIDLAALCKVVIKFCSSPIFLLLTAGKIIFRQISILFADDANTGSGIYFDDVSTESKIYLDEEFASPRGALREILLDDVSSYVKHMFGGVTQHANESALDGPSAFEAALDAPFLSFVWISISLVLRTIRVIGDALTIVSSAFIYPTFALSCAFKGQSYEVESTKASELEQFEHILSRLNAAPEELCTAFSPFVGK